MSDTQPKSYEWSLLSFTILILPVLVAIWCVPWFVTQDGPAHLYNAHILLELFKPGSPFHNFYNASWDPIPNLAGHLSLMGLMLILPARTADRIMMSFTLIGLASSVIWLRWRVVGWEGLLHIVPLAMILSLNVMWLLGFYSFLLGVCLFPVTLGIWWSNRDQMGPKQALILAGLLVLGYFCHLSSVGLTVIALIVLALTTPGPDLTRRCGWTAVTFIPLVPLLLLYGQLMHVGGKVYPVWTNLPRSFSLLKWAYYVLNADLLSLANKSTLPFVSSTSLWFALLTPVLWVGAALVVLLTTQLFMRQSQLHGSTTRGWAPLALTLVLGWAVAPDGFGEQHGGYLRARILLLGLIAIVPILRLDSKRLSSWVGTACLTIATVIQLAFVWDYALDSDHAGSEFMRAKSAVGTGHRIGTLLIMKPSRFKARPLLHLDNLFGIDTGNIVWNDYEASYYYFPAKFRTTSERQLNKEFEEIETIPPGKSSGSLDDLVNRWSCLLSTSHREMDVLVVWGSESRLDSINRQWYGPDPIFEGGNMRVFQLR